MSLHPPALLEYIFGNLLVLKVKHGFSRVAWQSSSGDGSNCGLRCYHCMPYVPSSVLLILSWFGGDHDNNVYLRAGLV